jgi:hypothetical protein
MGLYRFFLWSLFVFICYLIVNYFFNKLEVYLEIKHKIRLYDLVSIVLFFVVYVVGILNWSRR